MCLDSLADFKVPDPGVGWKVFSIEESKPHISGFFTWEHSVFYEWLDEKDFRNKAQAEKFLYTYLEGNQPYPFGFHIYLEKEGILYTLYEVILPVRFRHIVATGYEGDKKVVVAKEMMILAEESYDKN